MNSLSFYQMSPQRSNEIKNDIRTLVNNAEKKEQLNSYHQIAVSINEKIEIHNNLKISLIEELNRLGGFGLSKIKQNPQKAATIRPALEIIRDIKKDINNDVSLALLSEKKDLAIQIINNA